MEILIREPTPEDAGALGAVHVRAWQTAYRGGLMPDEYLDALSAGDRAEVWTEALAREPRPGGFRLLAETDGRIAGFALGGPEGGQEAAERGELYALNVDPDFWRRGVGRMLLADAHHRLADLRPVAVLWVHPDNVRARRFYEATGWEVEGSERTEEILGVTVPEIRYLRRFDTAQSLNARS